MEDRLRYILSLADGHLKYAETKNAALLVASGSLVALVLQFRDIAKDFQPWGVWYLTLVGVFCTVAFLITVLSFLPVTSVPRFYRHADCKESDSLLFFGDCRKQTEKSYLTALYRASATPATPFTALEEMYAAQIINNSRIAWRKFSYFRAACWTLIAGMLTPIGALVLFFFVFESDAVMQAS